MKQILLDTHALIWFANGDDQLPTKTRLSIEDTQNQCFASIASLWESAIKFSQGKLELGMSLNEFYLLLLQNGIEILPITFRHIQELVGLPYHHKDPFDRIIIAQAKTENFVVASRDDYFSQYSITVEWN